LCTTYLFLKYCIIKNLSAIGSYFLFLQEQIKDIIIITVFVAFIQLGMRLHIADETMRVTGVCEQTVRPSAVFGATS